MSQAREMDLEEFCAKYEQKDVDELWAIVACIYEPWFRRSPSTAGRLDYEDALSIFEGKIPLPPYAEKDLAPSWLMDDMADCAWRWCLTLAVHEGGWYNRLPSWFWRSEWLYGVRGSATYRRAGALLATTRNEVHLLCCTQDRKYTDLRKRLASLSGKSQLTTAAAIASVISTHVGIVTATALTPICAIMLLAVLGVGKEVLCERLSGRLTDHWELGLTLGDAKKPLWPLTPASSTTAAGAFHTRRASASPGDSRG